MMRFTLPAAAVLASLALPTYGLRADAGRPLLNADPSAQAGCASLPTSRQGFHILPPSGGNVGRIVAPDGRLFVPRGVAIMQGDEPPVQTVLTTFPGINFIRYAIYDYPDPNQIAPWVNALTQAGLVVEIENHNNGGGNAGGAGGPVFTGALLDKESRWYADTAAFFKANPGVWFGTNN